MAIIIIVIPDFGLKLFISRFPVFYFSFSVFAIQILLTSEFFSGYFNLDSVTLFESTDWIPVS